MTRFTAFLSASSSGQLYDVQQHPSRILGMPQTLPRQLALNLFAEPTGFMGTDPSTVLPSGQIFAPALPDTATLVGFGSVVLLSALATFVWANQVVPVARTNLARSKQRGPVRDYLDELQELKEAVVAAQHNNNNNATATTTHRETIAFSSCGCLPIGCCNTQQSVVGWGVKKNQRCPF